jgi:hypothetical protein
MKSLQRGLALIIALGLSTSVLASGSVIYEQLFDPEPPVDLEGGVSDGIPDQFYDVQVADNFVLASGTTINGAYWTGFSENFSTPDLSNFDSFAVRIYADDGADSPGDLLLEEIIPLAETNPVLLDEGGSVTDSDVYEFSVEFAELELEPGTYWLSVGSINTDPSGDAFVWAAGLEGDGLTMLDFGWDGMWEPASIGGPPVDIDMAFAIQAIGDDCPEDFDGGGTVGFNDLTFLLGSWGTPLADLDGDGVTGFNDLTLLLGNWGPC